MEQRYGTDPSRRYGTGVWNGGMERVWSRSLFRTSYFDLPPYIYPCLQCSNPPSLPPYLVPLQPIVPCPAQQRGAVVPAVAVPPQRVELGGWSISATNNGTFRIIYIYTYMYKFIKPMYMCIIILYVCMCIYICIYIHINICINLLVFFTKPTMSVELLICPEIVDNYTQSMQLGAPGH